MQWWRARAMQGLRPLIQQKIARHFAIESRQYSRTSAAAQYRHQRTQFGHGRSRFRNSERAQAWECEALHHPGFAAEKGSAYRAPGMDRAGHWPPPT